MEERVSKDCLIFLMMLLTFETYGDNDLVEIFFKNDDFVKNGLEGTAKNCIVMSIAERIYQYTALHTGGHSSKYCSTVNKEIVDAENTIKELGLDGIDAQKYLVESLDGIRKKLLNRTLKVQNN